MTIDTWVEARIRAGSRLALKGFKAVRARYNRWSFVENEQWKFFIAVAAVSLVALVLLDWVLSSDLALEYIPCPWPIGQASNYLLSAIPQTLGAILGVGFAVLLVGFQIASATFSKRAARLLLSDRLVLVSP